MADLVLRDEWVELVAQMMNRLPRPWKSLTGAQRQYYRGQAHTVLVAVVPPIRMDIGDEIEERCERVYRRDVFIPPTPAAIEQVHQAFGDAGLSVDAWSAHIMRYAHAGIASELRGAVSSIEEEGQDG